MKKIVLLVIVMMSYASINAQEPDKKKEVKPKSSSTQERSINESGISVKSKPQTKSNSKDIQPSSSGDKEKKASEKVKAVKEPE